MMTELLEIIKRAAVEAVAYTKPVETVFGLVSSAEPLQIKIDQKLTLSGEQIILPRRVTEYTVYMTVDHETGAVSDHTHGYSGNTYETPDHRHEYSGDTGLSGAHGHLASDPEVAITDAPDHAHPYKGETDPAGRHLHGYSGMTETAGGHSHEYTGMKPFVVHDALRQGEKLLMLRVQGGQRYVVLDRVVGT